MENVIKKDKFKLIENIYKLLPIYSGDREVQAKIKSYYSDKNISSAIGMKLLNKRASLESLGSMELLVFTQSLFIATKEKSINPENYFDNNLIEMEKLYKKPNEENPRTFTFHNVDKIADNHYVSTKTSYQDIAYLQNNNFGGYSFDTQREATVILKGKDIIKIPTLNRANLKAILEKMKTGRFTSNTISYNLEHTLKENPLIYNEEERTLTVELNEDEVMFIIDGFHRICQMCALIDESPNFPATTSVNIFNYTQDQAREFIDQEASGQKIAKSHRLMLSESDITMVMAKDLNKEGANYSKLFNKITSNWDEVKYDTKFVTFETISNSLKWCFNIDNSTNSNIIKEVFDVVFRGLNEVTIIKNKDFNDISESRKSSVATFNGMFVFYIAMIKRLYELRYHEELTIKDKNKFENKIKEVINKIDFNIENPLWKKFGIAGAKNKMSKSLSVIDSDNIMNYIKDTLILDELKEISTEESE
jgi:hypothetical protein